MMQRDWSADENNTEVNREPEQKTTASNA